MSEPENIIMKNLYSLCKNIEPVLDRLIEEEKMKNGCKFKKRKYYDLDDNEISYEEWVEEYEKNWIIVVEE